MRDYALDANLKSGRIGVCGSGLRKTPFRFLAGINEPSSFQLSSGCLGLLSTIYGRAGKLC